MGIEEKIYILGGHKHLDTIMAEKHRCGGLIPSFKPTVTGDIAISFYAGRDAPETDEGKEDALEGIVNYMQITYPNSMREYKINKTRVENMYEELKTYLSKIDPNLELAICDIAGFRIAGSIHMHWQEAFAAGTQCYSLRDAGNVQAIVMNDGRTTIYGIRLTSEHQGAFFAVTKGDIKLLQPIIAAVEDLKKTKRLNAILEV